jgi:hypothetical protein
VLVQDRSSFVDSHGECWHQTETAKRRMRAQECDSTARDGDLTFLIESRDPARLCRSRKVVQLDASGRAGRGGRLKTGRVKDSFCNGLWGIFSVFEADLPNKGQSPLEGLYPLHRPGSTPFIGRSHALREGA